MYRGEVWGDFVVCILDLARPQFILAVFETPRLCNLLNPCSQASWSDTIEGPSTAQLSSSAKPPANSLSLSQSRSKPLDRGTERVNSKFEVSPSAYSASRGNEGPPSSVLEGKGDGGGGVKDN